MNLNASRDPDGSRQRTYSTLLKDPVPRDLEWRDVRELLGQIAYVVEQPNGNLKVTRNGQTLVLRTSPAKDVVEAGELVELRNFLERTFQALPAHS